MTLGVSERGGDCEMKKDGGVERKQTRLINLFPTTDPIKAAVSAAEPLAVT